MFTAKDHLGLDTAKKQHVKCDIQVYYYNDRGT